MMSWLDALLLGLVQGLTEFLPVSSSGHLVLAQSLLGVARSGIFLEIALHAATLGAVLVFYRERITGLVIGALKGSPDAWRYGMKLCLATLPAVMVALAFGDFLESLYDVPWSVALALFATGLLLFTTRRTQAAASQQEPSWTAAFLIGCAQALAIVPGISRSGATVTAALALRVAPVPAAEFSFLMSVIAILGATVRALPEVSGVPAATLTLLSASAAVAFASGLAALWLFVRLLQTHHFHRFAYYLWAASGSFLLWIWLT